MAGMKIWWALVDKKTNELLGEDFDLVSRNRAALANIRITDDDGRVVSKLARVTVTIVMKP